MISTIISAIFITAALKHMLFFSQLRQFNYAFEDILVIVPQKYYSFTLNFYSLAAMALTKT